MKRILFIVLSLFCSQLYSMKPEDFVRLDRMKPSMRFQAIACMSVEDRQRALERYPELRFDFPKTGAAREFYFKQGEEKAAKKISEARLDAKSEEKSASKNKKQKNNKKKKKQSAAAAAPAAPAAPGREDLAEIKRGEAKKPAGCKDFLGFFYCFITDPTKYSGENFYILEQLLNANDNKEILRFLQKFADALEVPLDDIRECISMHYNHLIDLGQLEINNRFLIITSFVEKFFDTVIKNFNEHIAVIRRVYSKEIAAAGMLLEKKIPNVIETPEGKLLKKIAYCQHMVRESDSTKPELLAAVYENQDPKEAMDLVKNHLGELRENLKQVFGLEFDYIVNNLEKCIELKSYEYFYQNKDVYAKPFMKNVTQFLRTFLKEQKKRAFLAVYKLGMSEKEFFNAFDKELKLFEKPKKQAKATGSLTNVTRVPTAVAPEVKAQTEDVFSDSDSDEERVTRPTAAAAPAAPEKPVDPEFIAARGKLDKNLKSKHRKYMMRSLLAHKAPGYTIREDEKSFTIESAQNNRIVVIAKVGDKQNIPWFRAYNRNIGCVDKRDDGHMLFPPIAYDDKLKTFVCCEKTYHSTIFNRQVVIKNFPVKVSSIDETTPTMTGCLQIAIDQDVCFHRMFKKKDDLELELQEFVDSVFNTIE